MAVAKYGFDAVDGADAHHISGVPWDNRMENITLLTRSDHRRMHAEEQERRPDGNWK